jgi:hypothetical protein
MACRAVLRCAALNVHLAGLLELSSAVVFCKPTALRALGSLQALSVSFIPMPSLAALSHLPQLDSLVLRQAQPVSSSQCLALARCRHLQDLSLSSMLLADMPSLAPLTGLTKLAVQVGWARCWCKGKVGGVGCWCKGKVGGVGCWCKGRWVGGAWCKGYWDRQVRVGGGLQGVALVPCRAAADGTACACQPACWRSSVRFQTACPQHAAAVWLQMVLFLTPSAAEAVMCGLCA